MWKRQALQKGSKDFQLRDFNEKKYENEFMYIYA